MPAESRTRTGTWPKTGTRRIRFRGRQDPGAILLISPPYACKRTTLSVGTVSPGILSLSPFDRHLPRHVGSFRSGGPPRKEIDRTVHFLRPIRSPEVPTTGRKVSRTNPTFSSGQGFLEPLRRLLGPDPGMIPIDVSGGKEGGSRKGPDPFQVIFGLIVGYECSLLFP